MNAVTRRLTSGVKTTLVGAMTVTVALGAASAAMASGRPHDARHHASQHHASQHHAAHHRRLHASNPVPQPGGTTLYVSTSGTDTGNCQSLATACATVGFALSQASAGDLVLVERGVYLESKNPGGAPNLIGPSLTGVTLASDRANGATAANTVIDAQGVSVGVTVQANDATVEGLTVKDAQHEGILAEPDPSTWPATATAPAANVDNVTIAGNRVENNDEAFDTTAANLQDGCPTSPTDTDDCGEGIHLLAATNSSVIGNHVSFNVGGILVSDGGLAPISVGPAAHNVIAGNVSADNAIDCGITLPGHDPRAVSTSGQPQPKLAGVYDNLVKDNVSVRNGGAGLLDAAPYPGTGAYDNTFVGNHVDENGAGGFQLHSHAPQQDVSGNQVIGNFFGTDNLLGDPDSGDMATTGIILFSAVVPVTDTVVTGNVIRGNTDGVWQTSNVAAAGLNQNLFIDDDTDNFTQS